MYSSSPSMKSPGVPDSPESAEAGGIFEHFMAASSLKAVMLYYRQLCYCLKIKPTNFRNFYPKLKSKLRSWKAQALWVKFDKRASHKCYNHGKACQGTNVLVIGAGPCGLRTAIEAQLLGAKVVVVEKRDRLSRHNVLHLWPFVIADLRALGAKKFYGKFCAGSIDHISIRQLQCILLKVSLLLGVEIFENVSFEELLEPPEDQTEKIGWRARFSPLDHPVNQFEFDVLIGADGKRNTLHGFKRKEFRGKLAIAITANFINRHSEAEARVQEISGVAFIFNQKFFKELYAETGIDLENIVYYKDETHYFVMTAKKHSLIDKGVILQDHSDTQQLLHPSNVDSNALLEYAREAADFSTNCQLPYLEFAVNHYGKPDVAMFDFTSMFAAENACRVMDRKGHALLLALVGDSLLEPFWPTGSGCARGFLGSFDAAWLIRSWSSGKMTHLEALAERESIYRLLAQTTPENLNKDHSSYSLDPTSRYPTVNLRSVLPFQVKGLYNTDDPSRVEEALSHSKAVSNDDFPKKRKHKDSLIHPDTLLTWCRKQVSLYSNVKVENMTSSFKDGKVLCVIIHRYRPDLIDLSELNEDVAGNNQLAFDILEREFGIPPVMTGEEMEKYPMPDKLTMISYLSHIYDVFRTEIPYYRQSKDITDMEGESPHPAKVHTPPVNILKNLSNTSLLIKGLESPDTLEAEVEKRDDGRLRCSLIDGEAIKERKENKRRKKRRSDKLGAQEKADQESLRKLQCSPSEDFDGRVRELEAKFTDVSHNHGEKKPKDIVRSIGKIEKSDWNMAAIEKKIDDWANTAPELSSAREKVPKWNKDLYDDKFHMIERRLRENGETEETIAKYRDIDASLKRLEMKLREGSTLEAGLRGQNKVSSLANRLSSKWSRKEPEPQSPPKPSPRPVVPTPVSGSDLCHFCKTRVYLVERLSAEGKFFHRQCFKCDYCGAVLRLGNYIYDRERRYGGKFFCVPHYGLMPKNKNNSRQEAKEGISKDSWNSLVSPAVPTQSYDLSDGRIIEAASPAADARRGTTPERVEFENSVMVQSDEEEYLSEEEWTDRNFGASANELDATDEDDSDYSDLGCDEVPDDQHAEYIQGGPTLTVEETRKLAENWKRRYSSDNLDEFESDDSCKGSDSDLDSVGDSEGHGVEGDDSHTATEGEGEEDDEMEDEAAKVAREMRRRELDINFDAPPRNPETSDSGSETEMASDDDIEESDTQIDTDSEFENDHSKTPTKIPTIVIDDMNDPNLECERNHAGDKAKATVTSKSAVVQPVVQAAVVSSDTNLGNSTKHDDCHSSSLTNLIEAVKTNPHTEQLKRLLERTESSDTVSIQRNIQLKKNYLLGNPAQLPQKSVSTADLGDRFKSFMDKISETQKMLNPAPQPSPAMQAFLSSTTNLSSKGPILSPSSPNILADTSEVGAKMHSSSGVPDSSKKRLEGISHNDFTSDSSSGNAEDFTGFPLSVSTPEHENNVNDKNDVHCQSTKDTASDYDNVPQISMPVSSILAASPKQDGSNDVAPKKSPGSMSDDDDFGTLSSGQLDGVETVNELLLMANSPQSFLEETSPAVQCDSEAASDDMEGNLFVTESLQYSDAAEQQYIDDSGLLTDSTIDSTMQANFMNELNTSDFPSDVDIKFEQLANEAIGDANLSDFDFSSLGKKSYVSSVHFMDGDSPLLEDDSDGNECLTERVIGGLCKNTDENKHCSEDTLKLGDRLVDTEEIHKGNFSGVPHVTDEACETNFYLSNINVHEHVDELALAHEVTSERKLQEESIIIHTMLNTTEGLKEELLLDNFTNKSDPLEEQTTLHNIDNGELNKGGSLVGNIMSSIELLNEQTSVGSSTNKNGALLRNTLRENITSKIEPLEDIISKFEPVENIQIKVDPLSEKSSVETISSKNEPFEDIQEKIHPLQEKTLVQEVTSNVLLHEENISLDNVMSNGKSCEEGILVGNVETCELGVSADNTICSSITFNEKSLMDQATFKSGYSEESILPKCIESANEKLSLQAKENKSPGTEREECSPVLSPENVAAVDELSNWLVNIDDSLSIGEDLGYPETTSSTSKPSNKLLKSSETLARMASVESLGDTDSAFSTAHSIPNRVEETSVKPGLNAHFKNLEFMDTSESGSSPEAFSPFNQGYVMLDDSTPETSNNEETFLMDKVADNCSYPVNDVPVEDILNENDTSNETKCIDDGITLKDEANFNVTDHCKEEFATENILPDVPFTSLHNITNDSFKCKKQVSVFKERSNSFSSITESSSELGNNLDSKVHYTSAVTLAERQNSGEKLLEAEKPGKISKSHEHKSEKQVVSPVKNKEKDSELIRDMVMSKITRRSPEKGVRRGSRNSLNSLSYSSRTSLFSPQSSEDSNLETLSSPIPPPSPSVPPPYDDDDDEAGIQNFSEVPEKKCPLKTPDDNLDLKEKSQFSPKIRPLSSGSPTGKGLKAYDSREKLSPAKTVLPATPLTHPEQFASSGIKKELFEVASCSAFSTPIKASVASFSKVTSTPVTSTSKVMTPCTVERKKARESARLRAKLKSDVDLGLSPPLLVENLRERIKRGSASENESEEWMKQKSKEERLQELLAEHRQREAEGKCLPRQNRDARLKERLEEYWQKRSSTNEPLMSQMCLDGGLTKSTENFMKYQGQRPSLFDLESLQVFTASPSRMPRVRTEADNIPVPHQPPLPSHALQDNSAWEPASLPVTPHISSVDKKNVKKSKDRERRRSLIQVFTGMFSKSDEKKKTSTSPESDSRQSSFTSPSLESLQDAKPTPPKSPLLMREKLAWLRLSRTKDKNRECGKSRSASADVFQKEVKSEGCLPTGYSLPTSPCNEAFKTPSSASSPLQVSPHQASVKSRYLVQLSSQLLSPPHESEEENLYEDRHGVSGSSGATLERDPTQPRDPRQPNRKQRAAARAAKQAELKRLRLAQEIQRQLEECEVKTRELEERGVQVERGLRGEPGACAGQDEAELMSEWFNLVHEKNRLLRWEQELLIRAKELELEDFHVSLENELRQRMSLEEKEKTREDIDREGIILNDMLNILEQKNALVTMIEQDRQRYLEEDRDLEALMARKGVQLSPVRKETGV